jgi:dipeptidyl aminopeptidase/acylaminoacyl peptidase
MQFSRRHFLGAATAATAAASAASVLAAPKATPPRPVSIAAPAPLPAAVHQPDRLPLLDEALAALDRHSAHIAHRDRVALVDFAAHSSEARFHLVDVASGRIERSWLVAHGSGSDPGHSGMLQRFSNVYGSNATSRGAYLTANPYVGKYGRSQRLIGLDPDNYLAMDRAIVIHGAPYVDPALIDSQGRIGRSQGCFAFEHGEVGEVMERLGEGRLIYACRAA